jgi:hypothetical protein
MSAHLRIPDVAERGAEGRFMTQCRRSGWFVQTGGYRNPANAAGVVLEQQKRLLARKMIKVNARNRHLGYSAKGKAPEGY